MRKNLIDSTNFKVSCKRGQVHLPELLRVEFQLSRLKGFQIRTTELVRGSRGWEGGLAPALRLT